MAAVFGPGFASWCLSGETKDKISCSLSSVPLLFSCNSAWGFKKSRTKKQLPGGQGQELSLQGRASSCHQSWLPEGTNSDIRYPKPFIHPSRSAFTTFIRCALIIHSKEAFPIFLEALARSWAVSVGILQLDYSFALSHNLQQSPMRTAPENNPLNFLL